MSVWVREGKMISHCYRGPVNWPQNSNFRRGKQNL